MQVNLYPPGGIPRLCAVRVDIRPERANTWVE
jgi:hypothetical protein